MTPQQTIEQAIEACESALSYDRPYITKCQNAITNLRALLEQMKQQEPVGIVRFHKTGGNAGISWHIEPTGILPIDGEKLYTAPQLPQREGWQPIETAPKDDVVLVANIFFGRLCWAEAAKRCLGMWYRPTGHAVHQPTHWMPLPAAPKPTEGK